MNEEAIRLAEDLAEALRQSDAWAAAGGLLAAKNAEMADEIARLRAYIAANGPCDACDYRSIDDNCAIFADIDECDEYAGWQAALSAANPQPLDDSAATRIGQAARIV